MIKAAFFDVDGTLVSFRRKFLSDRVLADLAALRRRGIKVLLSTGRALQDLERTGMLRGARFDGYVTLGGQFCCDGDGTVFRDEPIGMDDIRGAYEVFMTHPELPAVMEGNGESYLTTVNDRVRQVYDFLHTQMYPVRDPAWLLEGKVYQLAPLVTPEEERIFLDAMPGCMSTRWHTEGIDILPRDGGKGAGIRAAMERYGLGGGHGFRRWGERHHHAGGGRDRCGHGQRGRTGEGRGGPRHRNGGRGRRVPGPAVLRAAPGGKMI